VTTTPATAVPYGRPYVTPECRVGYGNPMFRHGCPACFAPGYQHPVLGWVVVECACPHHTEEATP
jgi:hypothetical protein